MMDERDSDSEALPSSSLSSIEDDENNGPELSSQVLHELQRNDPVVTSVYAYWKEGAFVNTIDWRKKKWGSILGDNTRLKSFMLEVLDTSCHSPDGYQVDGATFKAFCEGLARNRSVERLRVGGCVITAELMEMLSPFVERNPHLCELVMNDCDMDSAACAVLTSALSNRTNKGYSLKKIDLTSSLQTGAGKEARELIASLNNGHHGSLLHLSLGGNTLGLESCVALGELLRNPLSKLEELYLECNEIDDECLEVLAAALIADDTPRTLKTLGLSQNADATSRGWLAFSAVLRDPRSTLEALHLSETSLDDDGAVAIADALVENVNTKLKVLGLNYCEDVSSDGWLAFFDSLKGGASLLSLEEISLNENYIDDDLAIAFADTFSKNNCGSKLKALRLNDNGSITGPGWQAISHMVQRSCNGLVKLDLCMNKMDDEGAVAMASAVAGSPSLKVLDMGFNSLVRAAGWNAFSACFRTSTSLTEIDLGANAIDDGIMLSLVNSLVGLKSLKKLNLHGLHRVTSGGWTTALEALLGKGSSGKSALEELKLDINNIDDKGAVMIASALASNNALKKIDLDSNPITDVGWQTFSRLLCDKSSIDDTFSSNHALCQICEHDSGKFDEDLRLFLYFNEGVNKREVARRKILWAHFQGNDAGRIDLGPFLIMGLKVMPRAFAWAGRNYAGQSLLYRLLRTMPSIVEPCREKRVGGNKRKLASMFV